MPNCDYIYTRIHSEPASFSPVSGSLYIYGYSPEVRSHLVDELLQGAGAAHLSFLKLQSLAGSTVADASTGTTYELRHASALGDLIRSYQAKTVYIDASGLETRICAALLRSVAPLLQTQEVNMMRVVYAEPYTYKIREFCAEGIVHDLAERIDGISPLPGFASIVPSMVEDVCFVPLLGFEGGRFTHLLEHVQPDQKNIIPVVGVPGFRPEYPFVSYWGNRRPLCETSSWRNVRYAVANSIVDAFDELARIRASRPSQVFKVAPIGTKPHAIGAILFALKHPQDVELVYDNPKREKQRTEGVGRILDTDVSQLLRDR